MSSRKYITQEKIEVVPVESVRPYGNNARNNADAVRGVAASIREFGFRNPILVDRDMVIIEGHTRRLAAISLGMERVPVIKATDLTPKQVRALRLVDNKVSEMATWDYDRLDAELEAIAAMDGDALDLGDMGFPSLDEGDLPADGAETGAAGESADAGGVAAPVPGGASQPGVEGVLPRELAGVSLTPDDRARIDVVAETPSERVIVIFRREEAGRFAELLGFRPDKVVYRLDEVAALIEGGRGGADDGNGCAG